MSQPPFVSRSKDPNDALPDRQVLSDNVFPSSAANILERLNNLDHWSKGQCLLFEANTFIREMKLYQVLLSNHLRSVQNAIDMLGPAIQPFMLGKGLDSLPDDILSMVFEYEKDTRNLSLVSRRFRRIVLSSPRLWNVISNAENMPDVAKSLERSKAAVLDIQLQLGESENVFVENDTKLGLLEALDSVLPHKERWKNLEMSTGNLEWKEAYFPLSQMAERMANIQLPRLERLYILHSLEFADAKPVEHLRNPNSIFHFYRSLDVPQLRRFHTLNLIPGPFKTPPPMLTSCKIEIWVYDIGPYGFHNLLGFLQSVPTLEKLSFYLCCHSTRYDGEFPTVVLQRLQVLKVTVLAPLSKAIMEFRKALITPAVRDLRITVTYGQYYLDNKFFQTCSEFALCHNKYLNLVELSMEFFMDWADRVERPCIQFYDIAWEKVPNLRVLSLDTPDAFPFECFSTDKPRIPALRAVKIWSPDEGWVDWLKDIRRSLDQQGDLPGLQLVGFSKPSTKPNLPFRVTDLFPKEVLQQIKRG